MSRTILLVLGIFFALTGLYILFAPHTFYDNTPGVAMMGPFNNHFIRDVSLAFLATGGIVLWGAWTRNRALALAGSIWVSLHAIYHVIIWVHRDFALDIITASDFGAVILPAALAFWFSLKLEEAGS